MTTQANNLNPSNLLDQYLEHQLKAVIDLFSILEKESLAIASRKAKQINDVAQQKLALIQQIQMQDRQIANHLSSHFPNHTEQEKTLTTTQNQHIQDIQAQLTQCHQRNEINGIAIQRAAISMHKLHNLFQEAVGNSTLTYNNEGHTSRSNNLGANLKA